MTTRGEKEMLGEEMHTTIKTLFQKGYNKSEIARMLEIDRKTVRKVLKELDENGVVERKKRKSILDPFKEFINIQVAKNLSAKRIFQDMKRDLGYEGSYDTVKRYVAQIKKSQPKAYMVLNSLPGEEAQVDFGYIGTIKLKNGKRKKAWIFIMELSYSRYMYVEIVFNQSVVTFLDCHKKAFKYFGGVPKTVKIDNLKAAILEADFYEPTIQRNYAAFAAHYGFLPEPCRVYTPTDKGKVESNVKYVKNNCFKGRDFKDIDEAKEFLDEWLKTIANVRIHGTTKKVPAEVFGEIERKELLPLKTEDFVISDFSTSTVMPNCHISYKGNYYSVPYIYIGEKVDILALDNLIKISHKGKEIALHHLIKDEKGKHQTNKNHYPSKKNITSEQIRSRQREEMAQIGEHALIFYEMFMKNSKHKYDYRTISGILSLRKKYDDKTIDNACHRAYTYGALKYKTVKNICEKGIDLLPVATNETYVNPKETSLSRDLSEYMKLLY